MNLIIQKVTVLETIVLSVHRVFSHDPRVAWVLESGMERLSKRLHRYIQCRLAVHQSVISECVTPHTSAWHAPACSSLRPAFGYTAAKPNFLGRKIVKVEPTDFSTSVLG